MKAFLTRQLHYACTALLFAQVAAPAAAQPRIPFPSVQPVTEQARALIESLSTTIEADPGELSASHLAEHAASSLRASRQDDIARLEAILRDLRAQRRRIHEKLETTPASDIDRRRKLARILQQVEAQITRCERQLAALLAEQEREDRRQSPAQQGPLSGGRFAFSNPAEQGERMPGTYTARNGRIFAATLLHLAGNAWAALVRTSGPGAGDMIARNDTTAARALGLQIKGAGGGYRVAIWGGSSEPQAAVINPQAAVAGAPLFESPRLSERGAVRFLGLAQQSNDSLGAGIIPAAALVAVARQPASFAGGINPPEPKTAPPPVPDVPSAPPAPCTHGPGEPCEHDFECCDLAHPAARFVCYRHEEEAAKRCLPTCQSNLFAECGPEFGPCCARSFEDTPLECALGSTPSSTLRCRPKCPSDKPYDILTRRCQCPDPTQVFNGSECVVPPRTPTAAATATAMPRPSGTPNNSRGGCVAYGRFNAPRCIPGIISSRECNPSNLDLDCVGFTGGGGPIT